MQFEVKFGSVSWINPTPNPIYFAGAAEILEPAWVPKTYVGLVATANDQPPAAIENFQAFQDKKQFRALTYCHLGVVVDDHSKAVTKVVSINGITDPGWTPPFSLWRYPSAAVGSAIDGWNAFKSTWSFQYHAGEQSPLSKIVVNGRHANTTIDSVPPGETVLANMIIKFRAGGITDSLGINVVKCPYHVPWVWCETVLTYQNEKFKVYGRGSIFPTHTWYLEGRQVMSKDQVGDDHFPKALLFPGAMGTVYAPMAVQFRNPFFINVPALALYPVLSAGAPAIGGQVPLNADAALGGPIPGHPHTAGAGPVMTYP